MNTLHTMFVDTEPPQPMSHMLPQESEHEPHVPTRFENIGWSVSNTLCVAIFAVFAAIALAHWLTSWVMP